MREPTIFNQVNKYAHARKTINIGHPAIVIERGYWRPRGKENDNQWRTDIFSAIELSKSSLFHISKYIHGEVEEISNYQDAGRRFILRSPYVKMSLVSDVYDEFWTIKLILDFSYSTGDIEGHVYLSRLRDELVKIETLIAGRLARSPSSSQGDADRDRVITEIRAMSEGVSCCILELYKAIVPIENPRFNKTGTSDHQLKKESPQANCFNLSDLFTSFVGLSLGMSVDTLYSGEGVRLNSDNVSGVLANVGTAKIPQNENDILAIIDAVWPVAKELNPYLSSGQPISEEISKREILKSSSRELTISRLNSGRGLYITSLGAYGDTTTSGHHPLSYLLLSPHRATWQIGRMIDRIHSLGTLRLAALVDYEKVVIANNDMRSLLDNINDPDLSVDHISSQLKLIGKDIDGGLRYRLEWSRHYLKLFSNSLSMVHFGNVMGYQAYDKFVQRKLGERFEIINSASRRLDYLKLQVRDKIAQSTTSAIKDILDFAEIFSIFPIAYYSYDVIERFNEEFKAYWNPCDHIHVVEDSVDGVFKRLRHICNREKLALDICPIQTLTLASQSLARRQVR